MAIRTLLAVIGLVWIGESAGLAQSDPVFGAPGLESNRDYWSELPFEHFDTATGSLTLTFTTLVVPGNAGRKLRFQQSYSNKSGLWIFGLPGMPLRVADPGWTTDPNNTSPTIYAVDGSENKALISLGGTLKMTDRFWKYDRAARILSMPDGTVTQYDASGRLTMWSDTFGNQVTVAWNTGGIVVSQLLGGQTRTVDVNFWDCTDLGMPGCLPSSIRLVDGNHTWSISGSFPIDASNPTKASSNFSLVFAPPAGRSWQISRSNLGAGQTLGVPGSITLVTPQGGQVFYDSGQTVFPGAGSFNILRGRTTTDPRGSSSGTRVYSYSFPFVIETGVYLRYTFISDPDGTTTKFRHDFVSNSSAAAAAYPARTYLAIERWVESGGSTWEHEYRTYVNVPIPSSNAGDSLPEIASQSISRGGQTYTTSYVYSASNYGDFHNPSQIIESGQLSRTTVRSYFHSSGAPFNAPYFVGKPALSQVTIGGQTLTASWTYDTSTGFQTSQTISGITTSFQANSSGNVSMVTKQNGKQTQFSYGWGRVSQRTTLGVTESYVVNSNGTIQSHTLAGRTTTYSYDTAFRQLSVQPPGGTTPLTTEYDNDGAWVKITRGASWLQTTVDGYGRAIGTLNSQGVRTRTAFNAVGRVTYQSLPFVPGVGSGDIGTTFAYDALGRLTTETNPGSPTTTRQRTYAGNAVTFIDELGRQTILTNQSFGDPSEMRLSSLSDAAGNTWSYQYNAAGSLTDVSAPGAVHRTWTYDSRNLLQTETHPESGRTQYTEYDLAGVLKRKIDERGITSFFSYDGNDRLVGISAGDQTTTYTYQSGSDLLSTVSIHTSAGGPATVTNTFTYDSAGRLSLRTDSIDGKTFELRYEYDGLDNVTAIVYPSGRRVGYAYDSENRVTRVFRPGSSEFNVAHDFQYHPSGAVTSYRSGNGLLTTIGVEPQRYRISSITAGALQLNYSYDNVGNVVGISDPRPSYSQTFTYDTLDRLKTAAGVYGSMLFDYDVHGNRLSANGTTYTYFGTSSRLQSVNGMPMTYDLNGNMLTEGTHATFVYRPDNLPSQVTVAGTATRYLYDANQWRARKATDGLFPTFFVRGPSGQLLTEWRNMSATGAAVKDYVYAGARLLTVWTAGLAPK
jgi:YD repeat-containing protein